MSYNVDIKVDNSAEVKRLLEERIDSILEEIGDKAESIMVEIIRQKDIIDTGRLMNSITHIIDSDDNSVIIGTNVEYAKFQELGTSSIAPRPFAKPTAENYKDVYQNVVKKNLKE